MMTLFQDYVMSAPAMAQTSLLEILTYLTERFPASERRIYHRLPSFFLNGRDIINVGAYGDHFGIHVGCGMADYLRRKYPAYSYTKSTIQFLYAQAVPMDILADICEKIEAAISDKT